MKTFFAAAIAASFAASAVAADVTVYAQANSTSGGSGALALHLAPGQAFTVTVDPADFWNAGDLPRWSNADGLAANVHFHAGMDAEIPVLPDGTQIGAVFSDWIQGGLTAPYGSLVGSFDGGAHFFRIGTSHSGFAPLGGGDLRLYYFDSNSGDNTGSISAHVAAVPEPETYAMLVAGLGVLGFVARRRRSA